MDDNPVIQFRCTTVIDGREHTATMSLKRSVWNSSNEQWRSEYLNSCRERYQAWLRQDAGIELTERQAADVSVTVVGETADGSPPPQLVTVTLFGGPLDGSTAPVEIDDDPWTAIISDGCAYPGGRSVYAPDSAGRWVWQRDVPWDAM
ncbi:hypothetical protein [Streptomyces sp. NPDC006855]|uniref:hypothetical protein n=1 Tax=Streptomyces sp. NPDC006855 TaxID=3364765 RepID=UPI0036B55074